MPLAKDDRADTTAAGDGRGSTFADAKPVPAWRKWLPLAVLVCLMALGFGLGLHKYLDLGEFIRQRATLQDFVDANLVVALGAYALLYIAVVALSLPGGAILTIAGGFLFGGFAGTAITVVSATIGAVIIFQAARTAFAETLRRRAGPFMTRLSDGFQKNAVSYLLFLRLVPVFPFWLVNIAPALAGIKLRTYALATFFGIIPGTLAFAFIGAGLDGVIAAQEAADPGCAAAGTCQIDPSALMTAELLIGLAALGCIAMLPVIVGKFRRAS